PTNSESNLGLFIIGCVVAALVLVGVIAGILQLTEDPTVQTRLYFQEETRTPTVQTRIPPTLP
ncbi:putative MHC class I antigen protein, partial [Naja naja]